MDVIVGLRAVVIKNRNNTKHRPLVVVADALAAQGMPVLNSGGSDVLEVQELSLDELKALLGAAVPALGSMRSQPLTSTVSKS